MAAEKSFEGLQLHVVHLNDVIAKDPVDQVEPDLNEIRKRVGEPRYQSVAELRRWMDEMKDAIDKAQQPPNVSKIIDRFLDELKKESGVDGKKEDKPMKSEDKRILRHDLPICLMINSLNLEELRKYAQEFRRRLFTTAIWDNIRGPTEWTTYYASRYGDHLFDEQNSEYMSFNLGDEDWRFEDDLFENENGMNDEKEEKDKEEESKDKEKELEEKNSLFAKHFDKAREGLYVTLEVECDDSADPEMELDCERAPHKDYPVRTSFLVVLL
jgi:hypothetical protein